jgi:hypothetical protein
MGAIFRPHVRPAGADLRRRAGRRLALHVSGVVGAFRQRGRMVRQSADRWKGMTVCEAATPQQPAR